MRARYSTRIRPGRDQDDIWIAFNALPLCLLPLAQYRQAPAELRWLDEVMNSIPQGKQRNDFFDDRTLFMSNLEKHLASLYTARGTHVRSSAVGKVYCSQHLLRPSDDDVSDAATEDEIEGLSMKINNYSRGLEKARKSQADSPSSTRASSLMMIEDLAKQHDGVISPLLKAYRDFCPVAEICLPCAAELGRLGKISSSENPDIYRPRT